MQQKLGYIKLLDDGADASLYEWCGLSAQNTADLRQEIQASRAQLNEKDAEIKKLQDSLAELAQMKNDNDTQLLQKFSLLLNEKKLKIRDQQRLLQTSNVDSAAVKAMEQTRLAVRARPAGSSRKGKRKADEPAEDDDDTDEGFVKMDVDDANESAHDLDQDQDPDEETADEDTQDEDEVEVDEEKDEEEDDPPIKQSGTRHTGSSQTMAVSNSPEPVAPKPSPAPAKGPPPVAEESDTEDDEL